jgi:hypothetical protein
VKKINLDVCLSILGLKRAEVFMSVCLLMGFPVADSFCMGRYLHASMLLHTSSVSKKHWDRVAECFNAKSDLSKTTPERLVSAAASKQGNGTRKRARSWGVPVASAFNELIKSIRCSGQDGIGADSGMLFVLDERCMDFTGEWCRACNMEATNHIKIKQMLYGSASEGSTLKEGIKAFKTFNSIPMSCDLPMGVRIMHDAYVFMYLICTFVAVLVGRLHSTDKPLTPTQVIQGVLFSPV